MEKKNKIYPVNFWIGFFLGGISLLLTLFFLGTKKGRSYLKKILELTENLEENIEVLLKEMDNNDNQEKKQEKNENLPSIINKIKNRLTF